MSSESPSITLCQSCLDRGLEPNEAICLYHKLPICDKCMGAIMDNKLDGPDETKLDPTSLEARKERAFGILDEFEKLTADWPLSAEESQNLHADFYNHCPPAIVNCSIEQLLLIHSRRKGLLWAMRHKEARWQSEIEIQKRTAREQANLTGMLKSKSEKTKGPSAINLEYKKKLAKTLGVSLEVLEAEGRKSQEREFAKIVEFDVKKIPSGVSGGLGAKSELEQLKAKVLETSASKAGKKEDPFTGEWK